MKVAALNRVDAQKIADRQEDALAAAYLRVLQAAGRKAAQRFRAMSPLTLTAADQPTGGKPPNWTPPDIDELVDLALIAEQTTRLTSSLHVKTLAQILDAYGRVLKQVTVGVPGKPAFDVTNPLALTLLDKIGGRSGDVAKSIRDDLAKIIGDAYTRGLSVLDTSALIQEQTDQFSEAQSRMLARTDLNGIANGGSVLAAKEVGVQYKSWLTASDDLVRPTHQDADGQTVPIDQPFDVGGESADYPGDPQLSDGEACNCRCTVIYTDSLGDDAEALTAAIPGVTIGGVMEPAQITIPLTFSIGTATTASTSQPDVFITDLTAAVTEPEPTPFESGAWALDPAAGRRWRAVLCVEGTPTEDGRLLETGSISWRDLPLTLMAQTETQPGHDGAEVCGRIDRIWREGTAIMGEGVFDSGDFGTEIARLVSDQTLRGLSVDLAVLDHEMRPMAEVDVEEDAPQMFVVTEGVIGAATVCSFQAIAQATIEVLTSAAGFKVLRVTRPFLPELFADAVTASAAPLYPPAGWFENPQLDKPTMLTVTDDGRVFGHVAPWKGCHAGYLGRCVPPPRSRSGYSHFHVGRVKTDDGALVEVGRLTLAAGHADTQGLTLEQARAHYDNTATVAAFVRAGEDEHGIWVAGVLRHDVPPAMVQDLLANPLSGDWRNGEMVAAHAVPLPGFPILQASAIGPDGDEQTALIITSTIGQDLPEPDLALRSRVLAARARGIEGLAALAHA